MLTYEKLKKKSREFLSATAMTEEEFAVLLPNFAVARRQTLSTELNR